MSDIRPSASIHLAGTGPTKRHGLDPGGWLAHSRASVKPYGAATGMLLLGLAAMLLATSNGSGASANAASPPRSAILLIQAESPSSAPKTLEEALLSYQWTWGKTKRITIFHADGEMTGLAVKTQWKITGPRTMQMTRVGRTFEVTFDETFGEYQSPEASGHRTSVLVDNSAGVGSGPAVPGGPSPSAVIPPAPPVSKIDDLREHASSMADFALGSLEGANGTSFQGYVTDLREDLLDEAARKPAASPAAYNLGVQFCNSLVAVGNERIAMIARLNNNLATNAAGEAAVKKVHPNWKDLVREQEEAAAATHNNKLETTFHKQIKVQWATRTVELRNYLDTEIAQFRQALRQSPPQK